MALVREDDEENIELPLQEEGENQEQDDGEGEQEAQGGEETAVEAERKAETRRERREARRQEHRELQELREDNRRRNEEIARLNETMREMSQRMVQSTETMARTAEQMGKPPQKSLEDRQAEELLQAAARVTNAADPGQSARYYREVAEINKRYASEIVAQAKNELLEEFKKTQQPSGPPPQDMQFYAVAPWLHEQYHHEGVQRMVRRLATTGRRDMKNMAVRNATIREAIAKYGAEEGLDVNLGGGSGGARPSPAVGGANRGGYGGGGGTGAGRPVYTAVMKRMADEHKDFRKLPASKRYDAYYDKIVKPNME